jgi:hypothetical protein
MNTPLSNSAALIRGGNSAGERSHSNPRGAPPFRWRRADAANATPERRILRKLRLSVQKWVRQVLAIPE